MGAVDGQLDEGALLAAARGGDGKALASLLSLYQPRIYRFGMKMCRNEEDAQDILQETLLAMARSLRDFRGGSSLSTWLYTIARSYCIKHRRRSKFAPEMEESLDASPTHEARQLPDPRRGIDEEVAGRRVEAALAEAIDELEPMYREVLLLRDVEGLAASEVAEVMGLSVDAVKSRLHRARVAVRERILPLLGVEESPTPRPPTCPDVVTLLSRHLEGEIDSDTCRKMEDHLAGCPHCRGACDTLRSTLAMCRNVPAPAVPPAVQEAVRRAVRGFLDLER